jgi:hypothetical protein
MNFNNKLFFVGELLKLNPSYKAPPDYKPLLKEARIPVPVCNCSSFSEFYSMHHHPGC